MIGWAIAGLALGTLQLSKENLAQNARCIPVFTLMAWNTDRARPLLRHVPQAETPPTAARPRREERIRLRPCLHLANA